MKKIIAGALAACMLLSVTACGKKDSGDAAADAQKVGKGLWDKYTDTVTLTTATYQYPSAKFPDGDSMTSNIWTRDYKEKFNIDVKTEWVAVDADAYLQKINLAIAEKKLPDVFCVKAPALKQLREAGLIIDTQKYIDEYASDKIKSYLKSDKDSVASGTTDGKLYGIPQLHQGYINKPQMLWLRDDWMKECNFSAPKTMDDVENIAKTFMSKYGGYGMATSNSLDFLNTLAPAWGALPNCWMKNDKGEIVYGSVQNEMKAAVEAMAKWYKEGIISKDFTVTDFAKMNQAVVAGKVGVQPYQQWWGYTPGSDVVANLGTDAIFTPYEIPSAIGKPVVQPFEFATKDYIVISKSCKDPAAAIKLVNYYSEVMDSKPGEYADDFLKAHNDNQMANIVGPFRIFNPDSEYSMYDEVNNAVKARDDSKITSRSGRSKYLNSIDYIDNKTPASVGDYLQQGSDKAAYGISKKILDDKNFYITELRGINPDTLNKAGSTLNDILKEGFTKIIIGDKPISYFDTLVKNWQDAGGKKATEEMNKLYK